jgi:hypothetical protein
VSYPIAFKEKYLSTIFDHAQVIILLIIKIDLVRNILRLKQRNQDLMLLKQLKKLKNLSNFQKLLIIKFRIKIL